MEKRRLSQLPLEKVFSDHELEVDSVIQYFQITATDGKTYDTQHYDLSAIIAVAEISQQREPKDQRVSVATGSRPSVCHGSPPPLRPWVTL